MNRRELLKLTITAGAASVLGDGAAAADRGSEEGRMEHGHTELKIVDTNVSLFHWPCRRLPLDEPDRLVAKLRSLGVVEAWAGSFEGILHRDITGVNQRLAEECAKRPELTPIGSINPELPGWEEDLRRCLEVHEMPGVRLHPNYHGYTLDDPRFARLVELARDRGRFVQVAASLEDVRTQHRLLQAPDVDLRPLPAVLQKLSGATVQILNWRPRQPLLETLAAIPGIHFDTARLEATDGVADLLRGLPPGRVMVGTHAPFLIPEATLIRISESNLADDRLTELLSGTAERVRRR